MSVLVDTSALSLAFRRAHAALSEEQKALVKQFRKLAHADLIRMIGMVRQEALSGIRLVTQYEALKTVLEGFEYLPTTLADHDLAADCNNRCRARGIASGPVDMLVCAIGIRHGLPIMTVDNDFTLYARHLPIELHQQI